MTIIYQFFPILALVREPKSLFGDYWTFYLVCLIAPATIALGLFYVAWRQDRAEAGDYRAVL